MEVGMRTRYRMQLYTGCNGTPEAMASARLGQVMGERVERTCHLANLNSALFIPAWPSLTSPSAALVKMPCRETIMVELP